MKTKRGSLKKTLLTKIIVSSAVIILIISQLSIKLAVDNIEPLTYNILARESITYASEIQSWWSNVTESSKLRQETENIASTSENLNKYTDEINSDLSQYTLK